MPPTQNLPVAIFVAFLFLVAILIQIVIVRWLFRVNAIVAALQAQTKLLQDLRTQTWHTRRACETIAGIATDTDDPRP